LAAQLKQEFKTDPLLLAEVFLAHTTDLKCLFKLNSQWAWQLVHPEVTTAKACPPV
jgi:hypothetical protein